MQAALASSADKARTRQARIPVRGCASPLRSSMYPVPCRVSIRPAVDIAATPTERGNALAIEGESCQWGVLETCRFGGEHLLLLFAKLLAARRAPS